MLNYENPKSNIYKAFTKDSLILSVEIIVTRNESNTRFGLFN